MSIQVGSHFLEQAHGGKGILLSGVSGVHRGKVAIIGGGTVGFNAAKIAVGMGAQVTILDINAQHLAEIDNIFDGKIQTLMSNTANIKKVVEEADLVVGAVPKTATEALSSATVHYAIEIANKGIDKAAAENNTILTGINTHQGDLTSKAVADSLDLPFTPYKG